MSVVRPSSLPSVRAPRRAVLRLKTSLQAHHYPYVYDGRGQNRRHGRCTCGAPLQAPRLLAASTYCPRRELCGDSCVRAASFGPTHALHTTRYIPAKAFHRRRREQLENDGSAQHAFVVEDLHLSRALHQLVEASKPYRIIRIILTTMLLRVLGLVPIDTKYGPQ